MQAKHTHTYIYFNKNIFSTARYLGMSEQTGVQHIMITGAFIYSINAYYQYALNTFLITVGGKIGHIKQMQTFKY